MFDLTKYSLAGKILALKMTGQVGPRTFGMLMTEFKTIDNILLAEMDELSELPGIGPSRTKRIFEADSHLDQAQATLDKLELFDTKVITCLDEDFPEILNELNDPPLLLFFKGKLPANNEKRVAIIGSQDVSAEGIGDTVELSKLITSEGISVVSGLARGIDTAGHMGALKADGLTYAILPSGFNHIYPADNEGLSKEIAKSGGLLSEYLPDTAVNTGRLMSRNRLIVGLSQAVIIGEISPDSVGTLDAALCCQQLGKLLFVVMSHDYPHYEQLTKNGAVPLTHIQEYKIVLESLV